MKRARVWLPAAIAAVLLASACTTPAPSDPTPTPTPIPSPTFTCTATPAAQCTAEKAAEEKQQAADYAAAEKAYRAFTAERNRLIKAGGVSSATSVMKQYAGGPYLNSIVGYLAAQKKNDLRGTTGLKVTYVLPSSGSHRTDAPANELTLKYCEDGSSNEVISASGKNSGHGYVIAGKLYARPIGNNWLIWDDDSERVSVCPK